MTRLLLAGAGLAFVMLNPPPSQAGSPFIDPSLQNGGVCPSFYTAAHCEFERDADAEWALEQQQLAKCNIEASRYNEEHGNASYGGWGPRAVECMAAAGRPEYFSNHGLSGIIKRVLNQWRAAGRSASDLEYGARYYQRILDIENEPNPFAKGSN
jgi:hypothetical protein